MAATAVLCMLFLFEASAQVNITGKQGLIYIPTARFSEDGDLTVGAAFFPGDYGFETVQSNPGRMIFANLTVLPRFDVNISLMQLFNTPDNPVKLGLGDRQLDFRYLILKEKPKQPSLAIIVSNPMSISPTVLTHALVATKNFTLKNNLSLEVTVGYGSPYHIYRKGTNLSNYGLFEALVVEKKNQYRRHKHYLEGPFGGASLRFKNKYGLMLEYDSKNLNVGLYALLFKRWTIQAGVLNAEQITFGTAYNFSLMKLPKRLTKSRD